MSVIYSQEPKSLILIVEDDEDTARLNARMLNRRGHEVLIAYDAVGARDYMRDRSPELYVLDIELPDGDGITLCDEIRRDGDAPVLFLSGRKSLDDKVSGMAAGGDYYLTKPYHMDEFIAVTERLLRKECHIKRKMEAAVREATEIIRGPLRLNIPQGRAYIDGVCVDLTPKEFAILLLLVQNEDRELSGEFIYMNVWGTVMNNDSTAIRLHISRLKKKLGAPKTDGISILTGYGGGYTFTTK